MTSLKNTKTKTIHIVITSRAPIPTELNGTLNRLKTKIVNKTIISFTINRAGE